MTNAELFHVVDTWIGPQDPTPEVGALGKLWHDVAKHHGPQSAPARGVLLDIVRFAYGDTSMHARRDEHDGSWVVFGTRGTLTTWSQRRRGTDEVDALGRALRYAP